MKVERDTKVVILAVVLFLLLTIPMVVYSAEELGLSSTVNLPPLSLNVELAENQLRRGEVMNVRFTLTNIGNNSIELAFPGQTFDFSVESMKGVIIYVWSWDKVFIAVMLEIELSPGESLQRTLSWTPSILGWFRLTGYTVTFWLGGWAEGVRLSLRAQPITFEVSK